MVDRRKRRGKRNVMLPRNRLVFICLGVMGVVLVINMVLLARTSNDDAWAGEANGINDLIGTVQNSALRGEANEKFGTIPSPHPGNYLRDTGNMAQGEESDTPTEGTRALETTKSKRLAYFIQVSERTIHLIPSMVEALYDPRHLYAIHMDASIPAEMIVTVLKAFDGYANVFFPDREYITYSGITIVINTINGLQLLTDKAKELDMEWDYLINLSGSDFPLLSAAGMQRVFDDLPSGLNFIDSISDKFSNGMLHRCLGIFLDSAVSGVAHGEMGRVGTKQYRQKPESFDINKGEAWMILSREFVDYTVNSGNGRRKLVFFATTEASDEFYFPTLLMDSPMRDTVIYNSFRHIVWLRKDPFHPNEKEFSGHHPFELDDPSFHEAMFTSKKLFARKIVNVDTHPIVIAQAHDNEAALQDTLEYIQHEVEHSKGQKPKEHKRKSGHEIHSRIKKDNEKMRVEQIQL